VELPDGTRMSGKRWLARSLWELVTTLRVTLPDGRTISPEPEGWFEVVKFIYAQIDGPPKQQIGMDIDFAKLTDAQLMAFITTGIATLGSSNSRGTEAESAPAAGNSADIPGVRPPG